MQFYKFWTSAQATFKGPNGDITINCRGYSNESVEHALVVAQERARESTQRNVDGNLSNYYSAGAIREEIVEEFDDADGQTIAIISRNSYGCLVLNTPNVFFADVDLPDSPVAPSLAPLVKGLFSLFKGSKLGELAGTLEDSLTGSPEGSDLAKTLETIVQSDASLRVRLYRTLKGFRVLIVSKLIPANSANSVDLLKKMKADKLYASLCKTQDCYRARLSPKPWRCDFHQPTVKFPYSSNAKQKQMEAWITSYESAASQFSTCHFVGEFGSASGNPVAMKIAELHDHFSLADKKPLA